MPATEPAELVSVMVAEPGVIAVENVAVTPEETGTLVAPSVGLIEVTVGAVGTEVTVTTGST